MIQDILRLPIRKAYSEFNSGHILTENPCKVRERRLGDTLLLLLRGNIPPTHIILSAVRITDKFFAGRDSDRSLLVRFNYYFCRIQHAQRIARARVAMNNIVNLS